MYKYLSLLIKILISSIHEQLNLNYDKSYNLLFICAIVKCNN